MLRTIGTMRVILPAVLVAACLFPVLAGPNDALLDQYRTRRAAVAADDSLALSRLALWCRDQGLTAQSRSCFEAALVADGESILARRGLGYEKVEGVWLRGPALKKARGLVRLEGRWVLREEAIAHQARRREALMKDEKRRVALEHAAHLVRALGSPAEASRTMAEKSLRGMTVETTFRPLVAAINSSGPVAMRRGAVAILAGYEPKDSLRPLIRASITDADATVRDAATSAVRAMGSPGMLAPYVTALGSMKPQIRQNAVDAIGKVGDVKGVQVLIRYWEQYGGGTPRSHIFTGTQTAFIRDFDVEVAQTAFIADPVIGTLQDGSVLETKVISMVRRFTTVERQIVRRALTSLAGVDLGDDVKAWVSWAAKNGHRASAAPADLEPTGDR